MAGIPNVVPVKNPDGTHSSELTISVSVKELNNGRETVIPTMIAGRRLSTKEAIRHAIASGLTYPSFESVEEATAYSRTRSKAGGAGTQGFIGKTMAHAKEPLTRGTKKGGSELTDRGKTKLRGQIDRAERIMRVEGGGRTSSEAYKSARKMRDRAKKLLGEPYNPHPHSSPKKRNYPVKKDVYAERREPAEKATGTDRIKAALIGVAKRANDANKG